MAIKFYKGSKPARVIRGLGDDATGGDDGLRDTGGSTSQTLAAAKVRAETDADKLKFERDKFDAEQAAASSTLATAAANRAAQGAYLQGLFQTGDPSAYGDINAQEKSGRDYINTQATNLLARLAGAKETATGLTTTGFDNLKNYLGANVPQAYATAQNAVPTVTANALAQYMASRGVGQQPVQAAVDTANARLTGDAGNYNQLLNVLRAQEASGQQSRLSEEQMARALAGSSLESTYGAGRAGVESEQLSALNQLATQISNARLQAKAVQDARNQALQDALAQLIGQGYVKPSGNGNGNGNDGGADTRTPAESSAALNAIAAGTSPQVGLESLLQLIAQAQEDPNRVSGGGGGFGNPVGNVMQMF